MSPQLFRPYQADDLPRVLSFLSHCFCSSSLSTWHPGDILYWMSHHYCGRDLDKRFWLYEQNGKLLAFAHVPAKAQGEFALIVEPRERDQLEMTLLNECRKFAQLEQQTTLVMSVATPDTKRRTNLKALGFREGDVNGVVVKRFLYEPEPEIKLPEGFSIRSVTGEHEAALLAELHHASFGSSYTPSDYLQVMRTPGFDKEHELVVVAPDGRLAAYLIYWPLPISKAGLFETAACHPDFRGKGLSKALFTAGMKRLAEAGMRLVLLSYCAGNTPAANLYASLGFHTHYEFLEYAKDLSAQKECVRRGNNSLTA